MSKEGEVYCHLMHCIAGSTVPLDLGFTTLNNSSSERYKIHLYAIHGSWLRRRIALPSVGGTGCDDNVVPHH